MHVARIVSRHSGREYVSYLLRQSYRQGAKVKHRTLANLSDLPIQVIETVRRGLALYLLKERYVADGAADKLTEQLYQGDVAGSKTVAIYLIRQIKHANHPLLADERNDSAVVGFVVTGKGTLRFSNYGLFVGIYVLD